jgi:hypothetical protein
MKPWRGIFSAESFRNMRKNKQYVGQSGAKVVLFGGHSTDGHLKKLENAIENTLNDFVAHRQEVIDKLRV